MAPILKSVRLPLSDPLGEEPRIPAETFAARADGAFPQRP